MDIRSLIRRSFDIARTRRSLWLFGVFAGTAGGARLDLGGGAAVAPLPAWVWLALALATVLGLAAAVMHLVSEAALIDAVPRAVAGAPTPVRDEMRTGAHHALRILAIKALAFGAMLAAAFVVVAPVAVVLLARAPIWAALLPAVPLAILAAPFFLTVHVLHLLAMRAAVLERRGAVDAFRAAFEWIHGRLAETLWVLVTEGVGTFVAGLGMAVVAFAAALPALLVWPLAGLVPAAIVAGALILPLAIAFTGALGTWRSSLWTLAFLEPRAATTA